MVPIQQGHLPREREILDSLGGVRIERKGGIKVQGEPKTRITTPIKINREVNCINLYITKTETSHPKLLFQGVICD